jgi:hypothetical protein
MRGRKGSSRLPFPSIIPGHCGGGKLPKKTPKSHKLVEDYLLYILDRGHHRFYKVNLDLSPEQIEGWRSGNSPNIDQLVNSGHASITEHSDWDEILEGRGQKGSIKIIERNIKIYHVIENYRKKNNLSIEKAINALKQDSRSNFGVHLSTDELKSIYKSYSQIFRFVRIPLKGQDGRINSWVYEDPFLNFPMRDAAAYALREMKVLWRYYPISRPTGILEGIHKLLNLPFEEDIEKEVPIYKVIRNRSFGLTYAESSNLRWRSMGSFATAVRFDNRAEKIEAALNWANNKYDISFDDLEEIYRHYRLIEAEANGQNQGQIFQRLEEDFKN